VGASSRNSRRTIASHPNYKRQKRQVASGSEQVQNGAVKTSVNLDEETAKEVGKTVSLIREDTATVLRMAIRAGLPIVASRFQAPRPEGYFAGDYNRIRPEQSELETHFSKMKLSPDR
jgi:hypothetical protein